MTAQELAKAIRRLSIRHQATLMDELADAGRTLSKADEFADVGKYTDELGDLGKYADDVPDGTQVRGGLDSGTGSSLSPPKGPDAGDVTPPRPPDAPDATTTKAAGVADDVPKAPTVPPKARGPPQKTVDYEGTSLPDQKDVDVKSLSDSVSLGLIGRWQDERNFYLAQLYSGNARIIRRSGTFWMSIANVQFPTTGGEIYDIDFVLDGFTLTMYINGSPVVSGEDANILSGKVGVFCQAQATFDNVTVIDQ